MSIREEWKKLVEEGELFRLAPLDGDRPARTVLLSREMEDLLNADMEEGEQADRRSRLLATLQNIVVGRRLVVCLEPHSARRATIIGRLAPIEESVFDVRCQEKPGVRVFCRFVEKDVLFAVTCRPRSVRMDWLGWLPLIQSQRWDEAIQATIREWTRFFPTYEPVKGDNLGDYLSKATLQRAQRRR
jgi:hypothetical protein